MTQYEGNDSEGTQKPGGLGEDGTIPPDPDGLGATTTDEASTFEPEEDEAADDEAEDESEAADDEAEAREPDVD